MNSDQLRFEAQQLESRVEHVQVESLKVGTIYFSVNFADKGLLIPTMEPVVFVGRDLDHGDVDQFYFQDIDSYLSGIGYPTSEADEGEGEANCYSGSAPIIHIFEFEGALDLLRACALRRRATIDQKGGPGDT